MARIVDRIESIVKDYYHTEFDDESLDYYRFITHLKFFAHCMTRLRFVLKDEAGIDDERVKKIPGVMGVMRKGGQYQIIIGNEVAKCFAELKKLGVASSDEPAEKPKEKMTLKGVGNAILDYISGSMSALIPALIEGAE